MIAPNVLRAIHNLLNPPLRFLKGREELCPTLNHHLRICKELKHFSPVAFDVSEEGTLCPAKGKEGHGCGNAKIDPHHARNSPVLEFPCCFPIRGIQTRCISVFAVFDQFQTFVEVLDMNESNHRTKDLFFCNGHTRMNLIEDCGANEKTIRISIDLDVPAIQDQFCPFLYSLLDLSQDLFLMLFRNNRTHLNPFLETISNF